MCWDEIYYEHIVSSLYFLYLNLLSPLPLHFVLVTKEARKDYGSTPEGRYSWRYSLTIYNVCGEQKNKYWQDMKDSDV